MLASAPEGRPRTRPPTTLGAIPHGHAQVPDLTFDCNIRARRRRRRRLSGGATQTGQYGSRTGLVCPSPARMAARQSSDPTDLSPRAPTATVTLGWARMSPTVQIDESEHWRGHGRQAQRQRRPRAQRAHARRGAVVGAGGEGRLRAPAEEEGEEEEEDVRPALMPGADARVGGAASSGWQRRNETAARRCGGDGRC